VRTTLPGKTRRHDRRDTTPSGRRSRPCTACRSAASRSTSSDPDPARAGYPHRAATGARGRGTRVARRLRTGRSRRPHSREGRSRATDVHRPRVLQKLRRAGTAGHHDWRTSCHPRERCAVGRPDGPVPPTRARRISRSEHGPVALRRSRPVAGLRMTAVCVARLRPRSQRLDLLLRQIRAPTVPERRNLWHDRVERVNRTVKIRPGIQVPTLSRDGPSRLAAGELGPGRLTRPGPRWPDYATSDCVAPEKTFAYSPRTSLERRPLLASAGAGDVRRAIHKCVLPSVHRTRLARRSSRIPVRPSRSSWSVAPAPSTVPAGGDGALGARSRASCQTECRLTGRRKAPGRSAPRLRRCGG
jgi:hypothetical protein